jgi:PilZ domain
LTPIDVLIARAEVEILMAEDSHTHSRIHRRTERVLIQVPIEVKGKDAEGRPFREASRTIVINRNGARIALRTVLRAESHVSITNLQNQMSCPFRVVGRVQKTIGLEPEWGVECLEPQVNFWGILFPDKNTAQAPEETVDVLVECIVCKTRELAQLSLEAYRGLVARSLVSRECAHCLDATDWRLCFMEEGEAGAIGAPAVKEKTRLRPSGVERRRAKRLTAKLPLRLRTTEGQEEITRTENLSKTGVCFYSRREIMTGDLVTLTVDYALGGPAREVRARVVWGRAVGGDEQYLYGAQLEESA